MQTIILSAFPGTGKTYFCKNVAQNFPGQNLVVKDSDSSTFDKSDFPANYMKHIKEQIGKVDVLCVSSHQEVRDAMEEAGIEYYAVTPDAALKNEYLQRFEDRGSPAGFITYIEEHWEGWTDLRSYAHLGNNLFTVGKDTYVTQVVQELLTEVRANGAS